MERPILFNTSMVRAIQEGRKTVTRRAIRPQPDGRPIRMTENSCYPGCYAIEGTPRVIRPPCQTGDILWVRETWARLPASPGGHFRPNGVYYYRADEDIRPEEQWLASCYSYAKGGSPDFPAGRRRAGGAAEGSYMGKCGRRRVRKSYAIR